MPKPKAFRPVNPASDTAHVDRSKLAPAILEKPSAEPVKTKAVCKIKPEDLHGRKEADTSAMHALSIDKHTENIRYKIAYSAHKLADELATVLSKRNKKDHNNVKGLVWSLGVLFDKLQGGQQEAVSVRIPSKLLENVRAVIQIQVEKKASKADPIDVTPKPPLDTESSATTA